MNLLESEQLKYQQAWELTEYSMFSPAKELVESGTFSSMINPPRNKPWTCWDFGCGAGAGGIALKERHNQCDVLFVDFVKVNPNLSPFIQQSLWHSLEPNVCDYGMCCDVMEHIPEAFTMLAASNMVQQTRQGVVFNISLMPDKLGEFIEKKLHLTVQTYSWWRDNLKEIGNVVDARDLISEALFYVRRT